MRLLGQHFARSRCAYPDDALLIVFDLDGAVFDQHDPAGEALDDFFIMNGLARPQPAEHARPGVLDVIRWFQLQPRTSVGFTTRRRGQDRVNTLETLMRLGRNQRLDVNDDLVQTYEGEADGPAVEAKLHALGAFAAAGYRTFAVVESDPAVAEALTRAHPGDDLLVLRLREAASDAVGAMELAMEGRDFDPTTLITERDLPEEMALVWHGVNDEVNLLEFLDSSVSWAECDVRRDPAGRLVLRHDSFVQTPWKRSEQLLPLASTIETMVAHGRNVKLDLKEGSTLLPDVFRVLDACGLDDHRLWFNGYIELLGADGFGELRSRFPHAIVQCPIDCLGPLVLAAPIETMVMLRMLASWGICRFSVKWDPELTAPLLERLHDWGCPVNIYGVPDLAAFLRAALLLPRSLTADFNFPDWNYFGRGAGVRLQYLHGRRRSIRAADGDYANCSLMSEDGAYGGERGSIGNLRGLLKAPDARDVDRWACDA